MGDSNHYETLGIEPNSDKDQIKKAYRQAAKKYHPDINKSAGSEEIFKLIQEAYEILIDEDKRSAYDKDLANSKTSFEDNKYTQETYSYTDNSDSSGRSTYRNKNKAPVFGLLNTGNIMTVIRIVVAFFLLVVLPVSEFVGKADLINNLILYYGWLFLFYIFTDLILGITYVGCFILFVSGLLNGTGSQVLWAIAGFFITSLISYIIKPSSLD